MGCRPAIFEANLDGETPTQAQGADADAVGCYPVYRCNRVPAGATAEGLSPLHDGAVSFPADARQRPARWWARVAEGREAEPTAGIFYSQSEKTTEAGGPRGYEAGNKIKGHKRHLVTDTLGNLLEGVVHGADI